MDLFEMEKKISLSVIVMLSASTSTSQLSAAVNAGSLFEKKKKSQKDLLSVAMMLYSSGIAHRRRSCSTMMFLSDVFCVLV